MRFRLVSVIFGFVHDAMLADEAHGQLVALRLRWRLRSVVAPIALVGLGIFLVADPDMLGVEQPDDGGEDRFAAEVAALQVLLDPPPERGSALPNSSSPSYFALSRFARKSAW